MGVKSIKEWAGDIKDAVVGKFPTQPQLGQDRFSIRVEPAIGKPPPPLMHIQNITRGGYIRSQQYYGKTYFVNENSKYIGFVDGEWFKIKFLERLGIYNANNQYLGTLMRIRRKLKWIEVSDANGRMMLLCGGVLIRKRVMVEGIYKAKRIKIYDINENVVGRLEGSRKFVILDKIKGIESFLLDTIPTDEGASFTLDFNRKYHIMFGISIVLEVYNALYRGVSATL